MDVDEHVVGAALQAAQRGLGLLEQRVGGVDVEVAREVHDAQAHAVALDNDLAAARLGAEVVRRAQDALGALEVGHDLAPPEGVVAERDHVDPGAQQLVGQPRRDAQAAGDVLRVDHDERRVVALAQGREHAQQRPPAGAADEVAGEEDRDGGVGHGDILSRSRS